MNLKTAKSLIKDYYVYHGEQVSCVEKIEREALAGGYKETAYLCKVSDRLFENGPIATICIINTDSNGEPYASEWTHGENREELKNTWIDETEGEDVDLFNDEDC